MKLCLEGICVEAFTEGGDPQCLVGGTAEVSAALLCLLRLVQPVLRQMLRIILLDYYALCSPLTGVISINRGPLDGLLLPKDCTIERVDEKENYFEAMTSCGIKVVCRVVEKGGSASQPPHRSIDRSAV